MKKKLALAASVALLPYFLAPLMADEIAGRTGIILFDTRYIANVDSYLTNDICHIDIVKTVNIIPDDTAVLVYARELSQTNASDWVQLLPQKTISEHPYDYALPNATNHDVSVTADYVPPSPVITNFMFKTSAIIIMGWQSVDSLPVVIPHTILETEDGK